MDKKANKDFVKKTMIFKQEHLDIINGIARKKHMQIKDVLEQLLEYSVNRIDYKEEARKLGKYLREAEKKIYFK